MSRVDEIRKLLDNYNVLSLGNDQKSIKKREGYSTGSRSLNYRLTGDPLVGIVIGRIYEIFGPESSGKTTLTLHIIAEVQKAGGIAAFIDVEHALDPVYAKSLGVNLDDLLFCQPDSGEQALQAAEAFVKQGVDIVIVDSVAALITQQELENDIGDSSVGSQARLMSSSLKKLTPTVSKHESIMVFTNQIRMKIGVMFGNPETTSGGNALKFYSTARLDVRINRSDKIIEKKKKEVADKKSLNEKKKKADKGSNEVEIGTYITVKTVKNKLYPPFKTCKLRINYGTGIDSIYDILSFAETVGIGEFDSLDDFKYDGKSFSIKKMEHEYVKKIYDEAKRMVDNTSNVKKA